MSDIQFDDPCVLFALGREAAPFLREFRPQERFTGAPCWAKFCGPSWLTVLVVQTGVGVKATETALSWLLSSPQLGGVPYRPSVIVSAGFAGALTDTSQIGDIFLANDVSDETGTVYQTTWPGELPAGEWRPPIRRGRLLTVSGIVADPRDKQTLGEKHQATTVDMESAVVARLCTKNRLPFGCVRTISDRIDTALSKEVAELIWEGRISPLRLLTTVVRSPRTVGEMWQLAKHTRFAAAQLATALSELLTLTLPDGAKL
jgi:nucleoside phosphorylase